MNAGVPRLPPMAAWKRAERRDREPYAERARLFEKHEAEPQLSALAKGGKDSK
jgi:hypothetical protein